MTFRADPKRSDGLRDGGRVIPGWREYGEPPGGTGIQKVA